MVGVAGLEPAASCTRNMHATNCAIPRIDLNHYKGRYIQCQAKILLNNVDTVFLNLELTVTVKRY